MIFDFSISCFIEEEQFGKRQSPIDIKTCEAVHERVKRSIDSQPLQIDYSKLNGVEMTLENTGHGWQLKVPDEVAAKCRKLIQIRFYSALQLITLFHIPYLAITGGKLKDKYQLLQIHAHWGKNSHSGSEHTINGKTYPAEIHLVHWNIKYKKASIAQENPDGLAVIGVFVELGEKSHPVLSIISGTVPSIPYKGDRKLIKNDHLELNQLIPKRESPNYWFYSGSLTTPPYSESVQWVVMKTPIFANESQVNF